MFLTRKPSDQSHNTHQPSRSSINKPIENAAAATCTVNFNNNEKKTSHQSTAPSAPTRRLRSTQTQMGPPVSRGSVFRPTEPPDSPLLLRSRSDSHTMDNFANSAVSLQAHRHQHMEFPPPSPFSYPPPRFNLPQPLPMSPTSQGMTATTNISQSRSASMPVRSFLPLSQQNSAGLVQRIVFQPPAILGDPFVDNSHNNSDTATTTQTTDFSEYINNSNTNRAALVDTWICNQLQDEAFVALCEDVETVWRRIAFGKRT